MVPPWLTTTPLPGARLAISVQGGADARGDLSWAPPSIPRRCSSPAAHGPVLPGCGR